MDKETVKFSTSAYVMTIDMRVKLAEVSYF